MKNIFKFLKWEKLKKSIKETASRFPISLMVIILITTLSYVLIHWDITELIKMDIARLLLSLLITFFFSLSVYITSEKEWFTKLKKNLLQLIPLWFWTILFFASKILVLPVVNVVIILKWIEFCFKIQPYLSFWVALT